MQNESAAISSRSTAVVPSLSMQYGEVQLSELEHLTSRFRRGSSPQQLIIIVFAKYRYCKEGRPVKEDEVAADTVLFMKDNFFNAVMHANELLLKVIG